MRRDRVPFSRPGPYLMGPWRLKVDSLSVGVENGSPDRGTGKGNQRAAPM